MKDQLRVGGGRVRTQEIQPLNCSTTAQHCDREVKVQKGTKEKENVCIIRCASLSKYIMHLSMVVNRFVHT